MTFENVTNVCSGGDLNLDWLLGVFVVLEGEFYFWRFGPVDIDDVNDAASMECDEGFVFVNPLAVVE